MTHNELEHHMFPYNEWINHKDKIPARWWDELNSEGSSPIGLGYTDKTGYYILASGQGPFIVWMEKEPYEN